MTMRASGGTLGSMGNSATLNQVTGTATPTGNGLTTVFNIAHGLGKAPSFCFVNAGNAITAALFTLTWDATNIVVTYIVAPTGVLSLKWKAEG